MESFYALDVTGFAMLMLGVALGGLLLGAGSAWRKLQRAMRDAPVRLALRQRGCTLSSQEARDADVRCALCPAKAGCRPLLERGKPLPAECPNAMHFEKGSRHLFAGKGARDLFA